jgi:putative inorganic carbon (hco3(-)) transporter
MSLTTIVWVLTYCIGTLASFINPLFGTLTYLFEYYLRPSLHWWGAPLPALRYNFIISTVLTVTYLMRRSTMPKLVDANRGPATFLLAMAVLMVLVSPMAVDSSRSWELFQSYLKFILFHGLIVATIRTAWAFDAFVLVHMLGAGWWGWEVYVDPKREASRLYNIGSGDTLGDNKAAVHLLSVIPFTLIYPLIHKDKRLKGIAAVVAPFVINALILCNSRGSTVGMLVAMAVAFVTTKPGHRLKAFGSGLALVGLFYVLADPEFIARQQTISNYQEDSSAQGRIESWEGGVNLIMDYPLGSGGGGYDRLSPIYIRDVVLAHDGNERAPHNTLVLVTSEWGIIGLALYLGYYVSCAWLLYQVRRTSPEGGIWYYRSVAVQMAMVGVLVAGFFTDRFYAEAPYWMGALAVALHRLNADRLSKRATEEAGATSSAPFRGGAHPATAHVAATQAGGL